MCFFQQALYKHKGNCHIFIKTVAEEEVTAGQITNAEKERQFKKIFGDICDEISFEYPTPSWPGFDLKTATPETGVYGHQVRSCEVCPYIFYGMPVNSDGTVSICFADWNRQALIGDVRNYTIPELWNMMDRYRIAHLTGRRKIMPGCDECMQPEFTAIDRIDEFRDEILAKMRH